METSEPLVITAMFGSADEALEAAASLRESGFADERLRISAGCVLHVSVSSDELSRVGEQVRALGAKDLRAATRPADAGWLSHITERTTGSRVMPGEGDSDAGS